MLACQHTGLAEEDAVAVHVCLRTTLVEEDAVVIDVGGQHKEPWQREAML